MDTPKDIKHILDCLFLFGKPTYTPLTLYDDSTHDYATIELITRETIAGDLEKEINKQLSVQSGVKASMRFITLGDEHDGRYRYAAEIVPYEWIPRHEWEDVTAAYLHRLPKVLVNIMKKRKKKNE